MSVAKIEFNHQQTASLGFMLNLLKSNPYQDYAAFYHEVEGLVSEMTELSEHIIKQLNELHYLQQPVVLFKNVPIDDALPIFDFHDPVAAKHKLKKTFVAEGILCFIGILMKSYPFGFASINDGDLFHDVYLKDALRDSASQKSMVSIGFHYDMGFFKVRPDFANLLCLRNPSCNKVSTSFALDQAILDGLTEQEKARLSRTAFRTKTEVLALKGERTSAYMPAHPVYYPQRAAKLSFFEGRTEAIEPEDQAILDKLAELIHLHKQRFYFEPGDLLCINNNLCIHGREVIEITDLEAHKTRWLLKTYNSNDETLFEDNKGHFVSAE
ncbi:TauD/TfdA family dioxygenase [Pseudoalteromonas ardens]|uniref:TauD/TfdA-like domain-containing protein n=1 Tax=Pseudoalteromonas rubra TaxID=43658 RepID=A0A0L0EWD8_9GAMM|nr:TauD/TfdA family dioxygenase [Pseudoalteromonas sp. R96]KNC68724.1 hypothetical protein AC626_02950 [Pseudoalteromonas rubra]MDK1310277.1 TauD/TfdA family dioxygenase [Pseudoalteromonas sp. R96]